MFYTIHRCIKLVFYCALLGVAWKAYEYRYLMEPASIWYDVWDNGGFQVQPLPTRTGRVFKVMNSQTFMMQAKKGVMVNVRLMGLRDPSQQLSTEAFEKERKRKEALEEMIQGNWVHVETAYENVNSIGGVVWVHGTNVNADLVLRGLAFTGKDLVKNLPKEDQYSFLWAKRHHQIAK